MKTTLNLALCLGMIAFLSAPLAGCSSTWHGVKDDWHSMTGSDESSETTTTTTTTAAQPAPAPQAEVAVPAQTDAVTHSETTTTTYNR